MVENNKPTYRLLHPTQPNSGMFAFIWQTIRGMYHFPDDKYYVHFGRESCFFDEEMYRTQEIDNVWDYYFEQPHTEVMPSKEDIISEVGLLDDPSSEFRDIYMPEELYEPRRAEYNSIIQKNVRLLPHVSEKIDDFYNNNFKDKKILGIHCRGTDHPDKLPMDYYVKHIKQYVDDYDAIFITSDEKYRVDYIKNIFGDKVIEYPTFRSISELPLHYQNNHGWSRYYLGEEVIIEAYLLSKTNMLLCCTSSNVNYYIRALNLQLPFKVLNK
jgi:hypothetical protein